MELHTTFLFRESAVSMVGRGGEVFGHCSFFASGHDCQTPGQLVVNVPQEYSAFFKVDFLEMVVFTNDGVAWYENVWQFEYLQTTYTN